MSIAIYKKRILLLLWHPDTQALTSGGFIRIKKFLKVTPADFVIDVLDNYPTIFEREKVSGKIYHYKISRFITVIKTKTFLLGRFLEGAVISLELLKKGIKLNKTRSYDCIYSPTGETFTVFAALALRSLFRVKVVIDSLNIEMPTETWKDYYHQLRLLGYSLSHSIALPLFIRLARPILIKCFNKADYIVTVSPYLMKKLRSLGVRTHIDFTPSGIDYANFQKAAPEKKLYDGIFIGRHEATKGIFDLISAWKIVVRTHSQATLLMVGSCDKATCSILMEKIKESNLTDNIILGGELSEGDKAKSIRRSRIYIHLALMEPLFPVISILEGLACGLPLVAYDVPAYKEIEEIHRNTAISLVPVGEYEKAASRIIRYLELGQPELNEISNIAQKYAKRFDWEQIADKEFAIIRNISQTGVS